MKDLSQHLFINHLSQYKLQFNTLREFEIWDFVLLISEWPFVLRISRMGKKLIVFRKISSFMFGILWKIQTSSTSSITESAIYLY